MISKRTRDITIDPILGAIATLKTQPRRTKECIYLLQKAIDKISLNTDDKELTDFYRLKRKRKYKYRRG